MRADLADVIARNSAVDADATAWFDGTMPLAIVSYLSAEIPPTNLITSVRGIVFRGDTILVVRNPDSSHIMPGGRREPEESLEDTFRREVREETGWTLTQIAILGFRHFHHLAPKPPMYRYPHPDFVWLICVADADQYRPIPRADDEYEIEAGFQPLAAVQQLSLTRAERRYLEAARQSRLQP